MLVGVFLPKESSILFTCTVEYVESGISASVVVWFLVYLAEKEAVKAKKSRQVLTQAKKAPSDILSACCIYIIGRCFAAELKLRSEVSRTILGFNHSHVID